MKFFEMMVPGVEIVIIAVVIYFLLSFFWNTRAMDLLVGLSSFIFVYYFARVLSPCNPDVDVIFYQCSRNCIVDYLSARLTYGAFTH